ncbi:MAG TPA: nucleotide exchange factor GrpE, partial [Clostridia bacterium]
MSKKAQDENSIDETVDTQAEYEDNTSELDSIREELNSKSQKCDEYFGMLQRTMAEFENYKKRTAKEKVEIYADAVCDAIGTLLPVVDNLERAVTAAASAEGNPLKEGIDMVLRQLKDTLKSMGVEEIAASGKFDPNVHNAVMHITDDSYEESTIVEEFQRGYIYKNKVI